MSGTFLDLSNSLVTTFVFPCNNLMKYFVISGSLVFISTRSTISLCLSFVYLRELPIWKVEVGVLVCVEYLQTLFYGLTRGIYNFCATASLITSSSTSGGNTVACLFLDPAL